MQNDSETGGIYSKPPLILFKGDRNVGNILIRLVHSMSSLALKCARLRCKTCPFIQNADKISGPKRSVKITDCFTCTSANVIYCITCTLCKKLYIDETGRRLGENTYAMLRKMKKTHPNKWPGILISLITVKNTCRSVAFPYIRLPW